MALTATEKTRRVRARRRANGQCVFCARLVAPWSISQCAVHLAQARQSPAETIWQPGGPGRPPVWATRQG